MSYSEWFEAHGKKHKAIMNKLKHLSKNEVLEYFIFENMLNNEPDFCPLYKENKKCHDIEKLNCYLCACPHFRFDDKGFKKQKNKVLYSICCIDSKDGSQYISDTAIHQNCAGCTLPHHESYIKKVFKKNWFEMMEDCYGS